MSDVLDQLLLLDKGRIGSFSTIGPASAVPVHSNQIGNELFGNSIRKMVSNETQLECLGHGRHDD